MPGLSSPAQARVLLWVRSHGFVSAFTGRACVTGCRLGGSFVAETGFLPTCVSGGRLSVAGAVFAYLADFMLCMCRYNESYMGWMLRTKVMMKKIDQQETERSTLRSQGFTQISFNLAQATCALITSKAELLRLERTKPQFSFDKSSIRYSTYLHQRCLPS